jgi:hypothetical protein
LLGIQILHRATTVASVALSAALLAACGGGSASDAGLGTPSATTGVAAPTTTTPAANTASTVWTECAQENGTCSFSGTRSVKYGVDATTVVATFANSVACDNATFGDPAVGQSKTCWVGGSSSAAAVTTPAPAPAVSVPSGVAWTGVSAAMWAEINSQRSSFGDANDCQARVNAIPTSGGVTLSPGADINSALASNSVVFLSAGTYKPSSRITVPAGKKLIGVAGQSVTIDASSVDFGALVQNNAVLANVIIESSNGDGVNFYYGPTDTGSTGALVYQVSVRHSGYYNASGTGSSGIRVSQNAANNCVVSSEASDTWNVLGAPNDHGGNSDGINNSFGANRNTFIDVHSYRNGDDGIDMWNGGQAYFYFSDAHDNGKTTGKSVTGDGNGIKLGIGSVAHKFYKTTATSNKSHGFNLNGNTMQPVLVLSSASGNSDTDYGNGANPP